MIDFSRKLIRCVLCLFAFVLIAAAAVATGQATIPKTPAGKVLSAYLDAFNSADRAQLDSYVKLYDPTQTTDNLLGFHELTGGFNLLSIESSEPRLITFKVQGKSDHLTAFGVLRLEGTDAAKVKELSIRLIPPGAKIDFKDLDEAARAKTIEAISAKLTEYYVYPDVAAKMVSTLKDHESKGDYKALVDGYEFADALRKDLFGVSHDKHLFVGYNPYITPEGGQGDGPRRPDPEALTRMRAEMEHDNCAFKKVEILPHNIGYLKFDEFADPSVCGPIVNAAMTFVSHTDALIIDVTDNHGGDPSMVELVVSYLFDEPTHINDLVNRHDNETHQYWTVPYLPGPRIVKQPVYVLSSHETFSGAEEFTYDLKTQKRATIVGEVTGGGAHPVDGMPAGDHFVIGVPLARPVNPITKTDWEGTGIEPDVKVAAADALATAQKLATEKLTTK